MKKVIQIQFSKESGARSALRLQEAFMNAGIQSGIISLQSGSVTTPYTRYLGKWQRIKARIDTKIQQYLFRHNRKEFGLFSYPVLGTDISGLKEVREADVIYIHWALGGFLNMNSFEKLAGLKKPVVIVMHDMWSISGGCHYSFTCDKYLSGCSNCPVLKDARPNDLSRTGFKKKLRLYEKHSNLYFVSPSKWLYDCAKKAMLTKNKPVFYIPNVLDTTLFKPFDKKTAKQILNLDSAKPVIAFGAVTVNSPYKGWRYLQEALDMLKKDDAFSELQVLIFGSGYNSEVADSIPYPATFMGYLSDEYSTLLAYNAADVFIVPSLADNQPTTVQESLCCGTPVVGFDVGGIPDMISHKQNGYIARYREAGDICNGVKFCLQHGLPGYMLSDFDPSKTIEKHIELFNLARQENRQNMSTV